MNKSDQYLSLWQLGCTPKEIAKKYGVSRQAVSKALKKHPDYQPKKKIEERNKGIRYHFANSVQPVEYIIQHFGVSRATVYRVCAGLERPKR